MTHRSRKGARFDFLYACLQIVDGLLGMMLAPFGKFTCFSGDLLDRHSRSRSSKKVVPKPGPVEEHIPSPT